MVATMLALCNFPKVVEAIIEVTSNHLESWIYPSKTQRGLSLSDIALFVGNFRLVIRVQGLFVLNCLVGTTREKPLGNGVTSWGSIKDRFYRQALQGKVGTLVGFFEVDFGFGGEDERTR
jgi:hypothetical protein